MAGLPESVRRLAELSPVEDVVLALLRMALPEIPVHSLVTYPHPVPSVLVRRTYTVNDGTGDPRFLDTADILVHCYAADPNGDADAAVLAEACRVALRDAWLQHRVVPGVGYLTKVLTRTPPRRVADWSTSSGPVQYADLPRGTWRYEAQYSITVRKPRTR
jgi:hypothetical protein